MDQRFFIAIALSLLVMVGYYYFFPPPPPKPPAEKSEPAPAKPLPPGGAVPATPSGANPLVSPPGVAAVTAAPAESVRPRKITVETPLYVATFDNRGARLIRFELKAYRVAMEIIDWGDLIPPLRQWIKKPPVDPEARINLAPVVKTGNDLFGVSFVGENSLTRQFNRKPFQVEDNGTVGGGQPGAPPPLVMKSQSADGLTLIKSFTFHPDSYLVDYRLSLINQGQQPLRVRLASLFGEGPDSEGQVGRFTGGHLGPVWMEDKSMDYEDSDDVSGTLQVPKPEWMGITDTYFITVAKPVDTPVDHGFFTSRQVESENGDSWVAAYGMELKQTLLVPGQRMEANFTMYLGPKKVSDLKVFDPGLEESLNLTLKWLATPMLVLMRWFHGYTANWGVAIILLTIVVRVLLFPLTYKGMLNIKRMQKLQPKMVALKEKFKKDKERLNKEMMGLYKKHKMNPLGGCLPIALQMPIFFALYSALLGAVELRHQPFIWWIQDLSSMDGLYVTPILMGGSMFLQQKLTPASMDPTQRKIMMFMPLVFTFFMLNFPSGLVLYWMTSNTLSIGQQLIINRIKVPEPED